jgi:hypothetical protein
MGGGIPDVSVHFIFHLGRGFALGNGRRAYEWILGRSNLRKRGFHVAESECSVLRDRRPRAKILMVREVEGLHATFLSFGPPSRPILPPLEGGRLASSSDMPCSEGMCQIRAEQ